MPPKRTFAATARDAAAAATVAAAAPVTAAAVEQLIKALVDMLHAQLVDTDTESDLEEAPSEADESQQLGSRVPLMSEEFEASEPSRTRTVSSHSLVSSNSTAPLSPDHPLTRVLPTPTPTRVSFHRRTAHMAVRTQSTLSLGMSARIAEAAASSLSSFHKSEEDELGDEDTKEDIEDESQGLDDEG
ncbi:hypothetical protein Tco_0570212 [Tanacetum coccineum]